MNREINSNFEKNKLKKHIDELREILYEVCAADEGIESLNKKMILSHQLDELIVKYMSENNE